MLMSFVYSLYAGSSGVLEWLLLHKLLRKAQNTHWLLSLVVGFSPACDSDEIPPVAVEADLLVLEGDSVLPFWVSLQEIDDCVLVPQPIAIRVGLQLFEQDLHGSTPQSHVRHTSEHSSSQFSAMLLLTLPKLLHLRMLYFECTEPDQERSESSMLLDGAE